VNDNRGNHEMTPAFFVAAALNVGLAILIFIILAIALGG
jgi:hypothetical protein